MVRQANSSLPGEGRGHQGASAEHTIMISLLATTTEADAYQLDDNVVPLYPSTPPLQANGGPHRDKHRENHTHVIQ